MFSIKSVPPYNIGLIFSAGRAELLNTLVSITILLSGNLRNAVTCNEPNEWLAKKMYKLHK